MGKLLPAMSLTAALALTIVTSAIVTNCGEDVPRRAGLDVRRGNSAGPRDRRNGCIRRCERRG